MNGLEIKDDVLKVGVRNFGLVKSGHGGFTISYLVSHKIRVDGVLAEAQLGRSPGLGSLTEMATRAGFSENQPPGLGFSVGLGW